MATAILSIILGAAFYFLPSLLANGSKKKNTASIFVLNLFLGWTLIGWVIALIWAVKKDA